MTTPLEQNITYDIRAGRPASPPVENLFDKNQGWIQQIFLPAFMICAIVSGFATFAGLHLFFDESGTTGLMASGTSVILTCAVSTILCVGWSVMYSYGAEARTLPLKGAMLGLGGALFAITLCVSSLSNLMFLVGPAAKVHDWRLTLTSTTEVVNAYGNRSLAVAKLKPGWLAEQARACQLEEDERDRGTVSTVGGGVGPVAVALSGVCAQTTAFIEAMDVSLVESEANLTRARAAQTAMRAAIRNRETSIVAREDAFLDAGDALNTAVQAIRAADLTGVLDAGAAQVATSVAELGADSSFSPQQVEMVASIRQSLDGLAEATREIANRLEKEPLPVYAPVSSPDFIAAILRHADRYITVAAAAIGIDAFQLWAMLFVLVSKGGKTSPRLRGQFEDLIASDTLTPLQMLDPSHPPKRRRWPWFKRKTRLN